MNEKSCDIVVIGGGGSGLVAAARAAEKGCTVVVLEKANYLGGGMLFASTMRTFRSKWQANRNIPDQTNDFMRKMMDLTLWKLDPELVKNALFATGEFFDWYAQYEKPEILAKYEARPYVFDIPINGQTGPQIDTFHSGSGKFIMETIIRRCEELGVELLKKSPATDIELTDGRISAVIADTPDGQLKVNCRTVILACSSWINNKEVIEKVLPAFNDADVLPSAHQNPAYTGDGLPIAEKAGALIDWKSFCLRIMGPICSAGDRSDLDMLTRLDTLILVDMNAKRFVAEPMVPRLDPFDTGHILIRHPKGRSFYILSANILKKGIADTQNAGPHADTDVFGLPKLPEIEVINGWFRKAREKGNTSIGMADTIEELAEQVGLDPKALRETVDAYNASCAAGEDWEYCKEPDKMIPLSEGPYYALGCKLATDGAFGGVRVNPQMQAYAADGGLVDGLYVTGDFASGRHIVVDGVKKQVLNDMSWALASGFIAGTNAAESL